MLNIENGNEENVGVKTFVIGEIVDLSLTFEDNTDPTVIINDMDFTLVTVSTFTTILLLDGALPFCFINENKNFL